LSFYDKILLLTSGDVGWQRVCAERPTFWTQPVRTAHLPHRLILAVE